MEILVNTYGTKLRTKGQRVKIITPDKKEQYISSRAIDKVIVNGAASVSTGVLALAQEHNFDLIFMNNLGKPIGRFVPYNSYGTPELRYAQTIFCKSDLAVMLAKKLIISKGTQQQKFLEKINKEYDLRIEKEIAQMKQTVKTLQEGSFDKQEVLGYEGSLANIYFDSLRKIIPFGKRGKDAKDLFNAGLNYGYAIVYSEVEKACMISGLDTTLGFLHGERYGKRPLVFDLMEEFRVEFVDQVICQLFLTNKLKRKEGVIEGYLLTKREKILVAQGVLDKMHHTYVCNKETLLGKGLIKNRVKEVCSLFSKMEVESFRNLEIEHEK